jgi:hypothetical protein
MYCLKRKAKYQQRISPNDKGLDFLNHVSEVRFMTQALQVPRHRLVIVNSMKTSYQYHGNSKKKSNYILVQ